MIYMPGLEDTIVANPDLIDIVEVEPATFFRKRAANSTTFEVSPRVLDWLRALPQPKLVHGVGFPVGGACSRPGPELDPLLQTIDALRPAWASEHLAFNRFRDGARVVECGFLLPLRQNREGVDQAARSIREVAARLPVPFAVEIGVNYLGPRSDEMRDSDFTGAVVAEAECGVVLDLHNLWTNERNGRETAREFLSRFPLESVWEIHVAGGFEVDGYWLDAHSGEVPEPVLALLETVLPEAPSLRAVIFEILPEYAPRVGAPALRRQLETLRRIVDGRSVSAPRLPMPLPPRTDVIASPSPDEWETALGSLVLGRPAPHRIDGFDDDGGIAILRKLVWQARAGMIAEHLRLTLTLLMLASDESAVRSALDDFFAATPPDLFGPAEALEFARFARRERSAVSPYLADVVALETAALCARLDEQPAIAQLTHDPRTLVDSLTRLQLPHDVPRGAYEVEVLPQ